MEEFGGGGVGFQLVKGGLDECVGDNKLGMSLLKLMFFLYSLGK